MVDWQPIETAPKDGTAILTYSMDARDDGRPYPMLIVAWDLPWEWTIFSEDGTIQTGTDYEPTHWAPLPASPIVAQQQCGGWECPINYEGCMENCGNYGCGN